jgi:DNA-3-methyladenine glycosylase
MLTGGPGRLCQAFGITRSTHNGMEVTRARSPLQIVDDGECPKKIDVTRRIGINKATERPLRFLASDDEWTSSS